MNFNFAKDLHRSGGLQALSQMEKVAKQQIKGKDMGLAFITEGFYGYDAIAVIANRKEHEKEQGYVVFDLDTSKAKFMLDTEE